MFHPRPVTHIHRGPVEARYDIAAAFKLSHQLNAKLAATPENYEALCIHSSGRIAESPVAARRLLRFDLIPLRDTFEEALIWTRPDFLVLRYELRSTAGLVARVSVSGMGESKHARGETSEGAWRFQVFPFASDLVRIERDEDHAEVGSFLRQPPFEIRLAGAGRYRIGDAKVKSTLEDDSGQPVFSFEQLDSFPKWQAEVKLDPRAVNIPELPVLLIAVCCLSVFR